MHRAIRVDLHIHSQASDGVWTPAELVEEVVKEGIDLFAVTDHNSIESVSCAEELARQKELYYLPAVEIDSTMEGGIYHILAYDIDTENGKLEELLAYNRNLQENRDIESLTILEKEGYPIDWEEYDTYEWDQARGGIKIINYCIDKGFCSDGPDFFNRLFNRQRPIPHPEYRHPSVVAKRIAEAGGIPILAHPFGSVGGTYPHDRSEIFIKMKEAGIRGMEAFSTYHSVEQIDTVAEFCRDNDLLVTGGSDSHGHFTAQRKLGRPYVTTAELELGEIAERAGLR